MFGLFPQVSSDGIPQYAQMNDQEVAEQLVTGIDSAFLARHSQDGDLFEWLQASAGASCMASIINFVERNRSMPYMFYCNYVNISRPRKADSEFNS